MKPVAIFRHVAHEGPGYLTEFLDERKIPWQLIAIDAGEAVPSAPDLFSGLVFMGGPMSANDALPWITPVLALIREAVAGDIPVLGHCLGGQLISRALGGTITRNPVKEIGWGEVTVANNDAARRWFGDRQHFSALHWHGETFSLPQNATLLLSSAHCANQACAIGKHLLLQCHVEMTAALIVSWCEIGAEELAAASNSPAVQSAAEIQNQISKRLPHLKAAADCLYSTWISGLRG